MSVSVRNIEKFFDDHPEFVTMREPVVAEAQRRAGGNRILVGRDAEELMGEAAQLFFSELLDPEHISLWVTDITGLMKEV